MRCKDLGGFTETLADVALATRSAGGFAQARRCRRVVGRIRVRKLGRSIALCGCVIFVEVATCQTPAYSRASHPKTAPCAGFCRPQYSDQTTWHDGQPYGPRSGGQGPLNASGSYGAMLEGRNPVGSTGF
jgi:hypothetical protein